MTFEQVDKTVKPITIKAASKVSKDNAIDTLRKIWAGGGAAIFSLLVITPILPKKWRETLARLIEVINLIVTKPTPLPED